MVAERGGGVVVGQRAEVLRLHLHGGEPGEGDVVLHQRLGHGLQRQGVHLRHLQHTRGAEFGYTLD